MLIVKNTNNYNYYDKKNKFCEVIESCGRERGIRTPGGVTLNGFQDRRFRPLSHLPIYQKNIYLFVTIYGGDTRIRTEESKLCRLMPYHLAMSPCLFRVVPKTGLEPVRTKVRGILSPLCLPFPPPGHLNMVAIRTPCCMYFCN